MTEEATEETTEESTSDSEDELEFVEDPVFDIEYKGDCAYEVKVSIAEANAKKQADDMYDDLKNDAELPGFRRGRAPRKLIENKFAKAVKGEVEAPVAVNTDPFCNCHLCLPP